MSRFRFVSENSDSYGVKRLCQVLGVSRSGYYSGRDRGPLTHAQRDGARCGGTSGRRVLRGRRVRE